MFLALAFVCNTQFDQCQPLVSPYLYPTREACDQANLEAKALMAQEGLDVMQMWCLSLGEEA